jgi:hypothetical protein
MDCCRGEIECGLAVERFVYRGEDRPSSFNNTWMTRFLPPAMTLQNPELWDRALPVRMLLRTFVQGDQCCEFQIMH